MRSPVHCACPLRPSGCCRRGASFSLRPRLRCGRTFVRRSVVPRSSSGAVRARIHLILCAELSPERDPRDFRLSLDLSRPSVGFLRHAGRSRRLLRVRGSTVSQVQSNVAFVAAIAAGTPCRIRWACSRADERCVFIMVTLLRPRALRLGYRRRRRAPTAGGIPRSPYRVGIDLNNPALSPDGDQDLLCGLAAAITGGVLALRPHARRIRQNPARRSAWRRVPLPLAGLPASLRSPLTRRRAQVQPINFISPDLVTGSSRRVLYRGVSAYRNAGRRPLGATLRVC